MAVYVFTPRRRPSKPTTPWDSPGSKVWFVKIAPGHYRIVPRTGKIQDLAGILHRPGQRTLTIDEINEGIARGAAASGMRGVLNEDDEDDDL